MVFCTMPLACVSFSLLGRDQLVFSECLISALIVDWVRVLRSWAKRGVLHVEQDLPTLPEPWYNSYCSILSFLCSVLSTVVWLLVFFSLTIALTVYLQFVGLNITLVYFVSLLFSMLCCVFTVVCLFLSLSLRFHVWYFSATFW